MLYDATGRVLCEEVLMDENKIVVVHEHRGCLSMMMRGCGWLILISVILTMLPPSSRFRGQDRYAYFLMILSV